MIFSYLITNLCNFLKLKKDLKDHNIPDEEIRKKMDELIEKAKSEFI